MVRPGKSPSATLCWLSNPMTDRSSGIGAPARSPRGRRPWRCGPKRRRWRSGDPRAGAPSRPPGNRRVIPTRSTSRTRSGTTVPPRTARCVAVQPATGRRDVIHAVDESDPGVALAHELLHRRLPAEDSSGAIDGTDGSEHVPLTRVTGEPRSPSGNSTSSWWNIRMYTKPSTRRRFSVSISAASKVRSTPVFTRTSSQPRSDAASWAPRIMSTANGVVSTSSLTTARMCVRCVRKLRAIPFGT